MQLKFTKIVFLFFLLSIFKSLNAFAGQVEILFTMKDSHFENSKIYKIITDEKGQNAYAQFKKNENWSTNKELRDAANFIANDALNLEKVLSNKTWQQNSKTQSNQSLTILITTKGNNISRQINLNDKNLTREDKRIEAWFNLIMEREENLRIINFKKIPMH